MKIVDNGSLAGRFTDQFVCLVFAILFLLKTEMTASFAFKKTDQTEENRCGTGLW